MAIVSDSAGVEIATEEDLRKAFRTALNRVGLTYEQLAEQARTRHFSSDLAYRTWVAVRHLAQLT